MRITLGELLDEEVQAIDLLEIISIEGQRYMARVHLAGGMKVISNAVGETVLFKSSWAIQDKLRELSIARTEVVHSSAYHEMIGLPDAPIEPMRIRVQGSEE